SPLPAVSHWNDFNLRVRQHIDQPLRDVLRHLLRIQGAFEFIGSNKDSHTTIVGRLWQTPTGGVSQKRPTTVIPSYSFSFRSKISPTSCGLAFPLDSLITCPLRKFSDATFPARKSATGFGLAAITSSHNFSFALTSLNCSLRFSFTIAAELLPVANISAKTSLPCLPLIFPLSIKFTNSSTPPGGMWTY